MIITLTGENNYLLKLKLGNIKDKFIEQNGDLSVEKIDCEDVEYERICESLQSLPFLASKKLVILINPSSNKKFSENFETLTDTISDSTETIIIESKLDKRTSYYKTLKSKTQFNELKILEPSELIGWVVQYVKDSNGIISRNDANFLVDRVGSDQQLVHNELNKLMSYNSSITKQTITLLCEPSPKSSIFELLDLAFNKNTKQAIETYDSQRMQKVEPNKILAMISWQLRILAIVKTAGDRNSSQIASEAGIHPFVVKKSITLSEKMLLSDIKSQIRKLHRLDIRLKSESINPDEALKQFIVSIAKN